MKRRSRSTSRERDLGKRYKDNASSDDRRTSDRNATNTTQRRSRERSPPSSRRYSPIRRRSPEYRSRNTPERASSSNKSAPTGILNPEACEEAIKEALFREYKNKLGALTSKMGSDKREDPLRRRFDDYHDRRTWVTTESKSRARSRSMSLERDRYSRHGQRSPDRELKRSRSPSPSPSYRSHTQSRTQDIKCPPPPRITSDSDEVYSPTLEDRRRDEVYSPTLENKRRDKIYTSQKVSRERDDWSRTEKETRLRDSKYSPSRANVSERDERYSQSRKWDQKPNKNYSSAREESRDRDSRYSPQRKTSRDHDRYATTKESDRMSRENSDALRSPPKQRNYTYSPPRRRNEDYHRDSPSPPRSSRRYHDSSEPERSREPHGNESQIKLPQGTSAKSSYPTDLSSIPSKDKRRLAVKFLDAILDFAYTEHPGPQGFLEVHSNSVESLISLKLPNLEEFILFHIGYRNLPSANQRDLDETIDGSEVPTSEKVLAFAELARKHELEVASAPPVRETDVQKSTGVEAAATSSAPKITKPPKKPIEAPPVDTRVCKKCKGADHLQLWQCPVFKKLGIKFKAEFLINSNLCLNCLGDHVRSECRADTRCKRCKEQHHSWIHGFERFVLDIKAPSENFKPTPTPK